MCQSHNLKVLSSGLRKGSLFGFPDSSLSRESSCNVGDLGLIPGLGRSPGERKDYPFQYSGLENSMDCIVHGVAKSWIQLSYFHFTFTFSHLWVCLSTLPVSKGENIVSHWYFNFHFLDPYCAWFSHVSIDYLDFVFMNCSHLLLVFLSVCIFSYHFPRVLYVLMLLFTSVNMLHL